MTTYDALIAYQERLATDPFWSKINAQLDAIGATKPDTAAGVIDIIGRSHGHGFFAGSGGDRTLWDALVTAGWSITWMEASYHWGAEHPVTGAQLTYVEGDVYDG